jgi:PTH1 family peptidyl-tRNA hydrolase
MRIIIGLGNPGQQYAGTRHNIGFQIIDGFYNENKTALNFSVWQKNKKFHAEICEGNFNGEKIILAKPETFMNESGIAVGALFHFYKIAPLELIVIHDDLDLPLGKIKVQANISSAGHNGIKSIIEKIGTQDFWRVRIGTSRADKEKNGETANFVLGRFNLFERLKLREIKKNALAEIQKLLTK